MLSELINEIEEILRQIVREEIKNAILESQGKLEINPNKSEKTKKETEPTLAKKEFPTILRAEDVAELLGVDKQRIYEIARQRAINGFPVIVLGERQYRFSKEAILEWIKRNQTEIKK